MTYKQILEEFDEKIGKFLKLVDQDAKTSAYSTTKSFLKQSFIKYLQGQLEITKRQQADPFIETEDFLDGFALCKSQAIAALQAQIKEIEEV